MRTKRRSGSHGNGAVTKKYAAVKDPGVCVCVCVRACVCACMCVKFTTSCMVLCYGKLSREKRHKLATTSR